MRSAQGSAVGGRPLLRADARVRVLAGAVEIEIGEDIYTVSTQYPEAMSNALMRMNGCIELEDLCQGIDISPSAIRSAVVQLVRLGALHTADPPPGEPFRLEDFAPTCRKLYAHWKRRLFGHALWIGLAEGTVPRTVFVGWAVESYWFIEGVLDRLPMAVAHCEHPGMRVIFARHFAEEYDHFHFFARTLASLGITELELSKGRPLPSTRAVQGWMRQAAIRDPIRYAVCSGFLESTGRDRDAARSFFERLAAHYDGAARSAVGPMEEHVSLDEAYQHGGLIEKVLAVDPEITHTRALAAMRSAYGLVETLELWSSDILCHYRSPSSLPLTTIRPYRRRLE